jgi:hypothetical protein
MNKLRRLQIGLVILHSLVLAWVTWNLVRSPHDALHQAPWFILFWIDFPATALLFLGWSAVPDSAFVAADAWTGAFFPAHPLSSFSNFWLPFLLYGVIGTWFWYKVPRIVNSLLKWLRIAT